MKTVRVLFLDDAPWHLPDLTSQGVRLEVIQEGQWGSMNVYSAPRQVCEAVKKLTTSKEVDIVVVGNNLGAGVAKAKAIAEDMKEKTIVVWNSYSRGNEAHYARLGLTHFGSRTDLRQMVSALLGVS